MATHLFFFFFDVIAACLFFFSLGEGVVFGSVRVPAFSFRRAQDLFATVIPLLLRCTKGCYEPLLYLPITYRYLRRAHLLSQSGDAPSPSLSDGRAFRARRPFLAPARVLFCERAMSIVFFFFSPTRKDCFPIE